MASALGLCGTIGVLPISSCTDSNDAPRDAGIRDAAALPERGAGVRDAAAVPESDAISSIAPDAMVPGSFCALPGSVVATANGVAVVAGANPQLPDMSWLRVPVGYCAHHFANVAETRQLRVSPSGDLFVASPSTPTSGGEQRTGLGAVVVLPDDDHDGIADSTVTFLPKADAGIGLPQVQGLAFAGGYLYFQDGATVRRVAFKAGDRAPSASAEKVTTITAPQSSNHWPKVFDLAKDGTLYVTNGSDQGEACLSTRPAVGAVFKVTSGGGTSLMAKGFRNAIALRCEADHNVCLVAELAKDGSGAEGGREKLVPIREGDDWGFPCCATTNVAYATTAFQDNGQTVKASDCAGVTQETVSFQIGHTPFGLDFETGIWTDGWSRRVFVALHGDVGSYIGSRVVALALDSNGLPLPSSDVPSGASETPTMKDFVTGWDDGRQDHGRATAVAFGPDGRLYIGDDTLGEIFWVAPVGLMRP
jgi:glucose/arabinose dehydrogenase